MKLWKTAGITAALLGAAGVAAAVAPVAHGQTTRVAVAPQGFEVFNFSGGRIGVSVSDVEAASGDAKGAAGVVIESVEEGSPAEKAGLRKGDVVVEFDGERVRSVRQFTRLVSETPAGRTVSAAVQRGGQRVTVNITTRESDAARLLQGDSWRRLEELRTIPRLTRPTPTPRPPAFERAFPGGSQIGITATDLSPQLAEYFGTKEGVLVSAVRDDSAASKAGVKAGDVITTVNGMTVESPAELRRRLQRIETGEEFTLGIVRDKKSMTIKGKAESGRPRRSTTRTIL